jgi:hypothetical protein
MSSLKKTDHNNIWYVSASLVALGMPAVLGATF